MNSCRISSMVSEFERFCVTHACASWCVGQSNYCPLAVFSKVFYGDVDGRRCKRIYEEMESEYGQRTYIGACGIPGKI